MLLPTGRCATWKMLTDGVDSSVTCSASSAAPDPPDPPDPTDISTSAPVSLGVGAPPDAATHSNNIIHHDQHCQI